jgi:serine phosphatase RsbU (regulator of sigma subunit)
MANGTEFGIITIEEIRRKQDILEQELRSVAQYATSLLPVPGSLLPSVHIACTHQPALNLGGDLFNVLPWGAGVRRLPSG